MTTDGGGLDGPGVAPERDTRGMTPATALPHGVDRRRLTIDALTIVVILAGIACLVGAAMFARSHTSDGGSGLHPGDRRSTEFGVVRVLEGPLGPELMFPDCTTAMVEAGGGKLVDFDPVRDAHLPPPEGASTWAWNCGSTP